jgi:hypothetical protein
MKWLGWLAVKPEGQCGAGSSDQKTSGTNMAYFIHQQRVRVTNDDGTSRSVLAGVVIVLAEPGGLALLGGSPMPCSTSST